MRVVGSAREKRGQIPLCCSNGPLNIPQPVGLSLDVDFLKTSEQEEENIVGLDFGDDLLSWWTLQVAVHRTVYLAIVPAIFDSSFKVPEIIRTF